ncbi:LLM class oxidoreductase [Pseudonocardia acaciae]|uniref:LLM class oxidoreductase n=1 Tax=Pseudonocardia acaciae TaxID=551276 RepID=UPI000A8C8E85|nr:LLM class oxidoreductase [Pseudonocardia acaciae]
MSVTQPQATQPATGAFDRHPGYRRMFAPDRLTLGLFLPLWPYNGDPDGLRGHGEIVARADRGGLAGLWVRDIPLHDTRFGDVGQVYDPWTTLTWLAAHTDRIALAAGSVVATLRHPIDLAKQAASLDRLSGGRLVLGVASGDRASEFPAYGIGYDDRAARFAETLPLVRRLLTERFPRVDSELARMDGSTDLLPKPTVGTVPLIVTGSSRQTQEWIAAHSDGWLVYPGVTHTPEGPVALGQKIQGWRAHIPGGAFKPAITNEWIDLDEDPNHPPTPLRGGFVLRTGRNALIEQLGRWRDNGINHVALGVQHGRRPAADAVAEIVAEILPLFPSLNGPEPSAPAW